MVMNYYDFFTKKESAALYRELLDTTCRTEALMDIKNYMEDRLDTRFNAAFVYLCRDLEEINNPVPGNSITLLFTSDEIDQPVIYVGLAK